MNYAAPTDLERRAIDAPPKPYANRAIEKLVACLREVGTATVRCDERDERHAVMVAQLLMNELCEPITVSRVDGGLRFTREWAAKRRRA